MGLTRGGIELLFGSKVSEVTECGAENLQLADPIGQYMMRALFHDHPSSSVREFTLQLLLRSEMANMEYSEGRNSLSEYLTDPIAKTLLYFHAVHHFTASIGQIWQFLDLNRSKYRHRMGKRIDIYKPNDESIFERLNIIYNESRHVAVDYESIHQPIWITNTGIASESAELSFHELRETLEKLSNSCLKLLDPDLQRERPAGNAPGTGKSGGGQP